MRLVSPSLPLVASLLACGTTEDSPDSSPGEAIYRGTVADGNSWSCATCHALEEPADDFRRPAHPIGDAAARPSYKNGQVAQMRDAVNSCLSEWMNAEPWSAEDPRWIELEAFLRDIAPSSAPALVYTIVDAPVELDGGDASVGRQVFDASCAVCHAAGGEGSELAPPVARLGLDPAYVAERVRHSGRADSEVYDGLSGGIMPFWAADRLSDAELRDIIAFLRETDAADDGVAEGGGGTPGDADDGANDSGDADAGSTDDGGETSSASDGAQDDDGDSGGPTPVNCPITHERVGWVADLSAQFHGVGGRAEIVDDCTVVIHDFTYDGTGIDVRLYGGVDGDYDGGYPMTDDLIKPGGYDGTELEAVLPDGVTLDQLDGVSVWCVDVGIDFGSGSFSPP
ncbi:MAG: DM13 domain-containing protein [Myxococcales bacterium]|nr:DM13 domain-containing protein [Myxococcales bacterium]